LILSLYLPAAVLALGQSMIAPVLPNLTRSFGVGLAEASLVFVAFGAGAVVATFPAGYLMDKTAGGRCCWRGRGFLYLAACSSIVVLGVTRVLDNTMARVDQSERQRGASQALS
jgi:MFS family permease